MVNHLQEESQFPQAPAWKDKHDLSMGVFGSRKVWSLPWGSHMLPTYHLLREPETTMEFMVKHLTFDHGKSLRLFQHTELEHTPRNLYQQTINKGIPDS